MSDVVGGWSGSLVSTESGRDGQVKMEKREGERDRGGEAVLNWKTYWSADRHGMAMMSSS